MMDNVAPHRAMLLGRELPQFLAEDARVITNPVLLLTGEFSPKIMYISNEKLAELIPGAQHHIVPNASHLIHEDNPAFIVEEILRFTACCEQQ